jgi:hypothetical protein
MLSNGTRWDIGLEITEDDRRVFRGYSPLTAERYFINPPTNVPPPHGKEKDGSRQDKQQRS